MLRRYLSTLLSFQDGIERDDLADRLWPESEGDRAIRNLSAATTDLRRVLQKLGGLALEVRRGRYRLMRQPHQQSRGIDL